MPQYYYRTRKAGAPIVWQGEHEIELPSRWSICTTCRGNGAHSHRFGAISQEQMDEWTDDDRSHYFSGAYDEACSVCEGTGKVLVPDRERCSKTLLALWDDQETLEAEEEATWWNEMRYCYGPNF